MGLAALKFEYELNAIECAACAIVFGVPADYERRRREDHQGFWCPQS